MIGKEWKEHTKSVLRNFFLDNLFEPNRLKRKRNHMPIPLQIIHISLRGYLLGQLFYRKINIFHRKRASQQPYFENYRRVPLQNKNKGTSIVRQEHEKQQEFGVGGCYQRFSFTIVIFRTINRKYKELVHSFIYSDPKQWPSCTTMYRDYNFKTDNIIPYEHIYLYYKHLCEKK